MIKTINITKEYQKELEHINKQYNQSRYILELVRADMKKEKENEQIVEVVRQSLQNVHSQSINNTMQNVNNKVKVGGDDKRKSSAMSLFE